MFLTTLKPFKDNGKYSLYAYCLMTNHVHILMQELDDEISTSIKRISASYVFWYNRKYERCGHLFQEGFKSEVVFSTNRKKAIGLFIKYHKKDNNDKCLDYEDFIRLTDKEAREEIANLGIENISILQHLEKSDRDNLLRKLKGITGVSVRQLARITGISKSVIDRA